ncbi:hypothetical protein BC351_29060 [Paenibacillus ferrarius]|uniref:Uncharacterized protein n=1 Tax=Paenibacillus ferrarius TaxID=1469647 RepID=A0A1V4HHE1_9BACL|nr:hypothetical protein [Paenibacillus ferrarius]OPH56219.1 hypothetical protein BC351_29060 [Paenibacillus ferrarius]
MLMWRFQDVRDEHVDDSYKAVYPSIEEGLGYTRKNPALFCRSVPGDRVALAPTYGSDTRRLTTIREETIDDTIMATKLNQAGSAQ